MTTAKSPEEKAKIKQRNNLKFIHNSVVSYWTQGKIHNWRDVYVKLGYSDEHINKTYLPADLEKGLTFKELKDYLDGMSRELEQKLGTHEVGQPSQEVNPFPKESDAHKAYEVAHRSDIVSQANEHVASILPPPTTQTQEEVFKLTSEPEASKDVSLSASNDYGLHPSDRENTFMYWFQKKAVKEMWDKIVVEKKTGVLLLAAGGFGKTFMIAGLHARLMDADYQDGKTFSHIPYLYITRATVVEQHKRVFQKYFCTDTVNEIEVINVEQMRSKNGKLWVKEEVKIIGGEEVSVWKWTPNINPCVVYFDESQAAKNESSTTHKIMCAYNDLKKNACLVSISATPFTNVQEAKCFAVSTHRPLEHLGFPVGTRLTNENFDAYARIICGEKTSPDEHNEAALDRLMKDLEPWVVRVKGVVPQFKGINGVERINFRTVKQRDYYLDAYNRFLREQAERKAQEDSGTAEKNYCIFTELLKFSMAAEFCHAPDIAAKMYDSVKRGKAAACAVKFKGTIIETTRILNEEYGVSREEISLVWGGGQTQLTAKQKAKKKIKEQEAKLIAAGLSLKELLEDCDLDEVEDRELMNLPEHMRLGAQSKEERQVEIDKYQRGDTLYVFYTFRAGGVGLSLHHSDELTEHWDTSVAGYAEWKKDIDAYNDSVSEHKRVKPGKVRRKESGYAVEKDIPFIPVRQRETFLGPTYSGIDMAQGLWRVPRLTSLSDTIQTILLYNGTIEIEIFDILSAKLKCINTVSRTKENWLDAYLDKAKREMYIKSTEGVVDSEDAGEPETEED